MPSVRLSGRSIVAALVVFASLGCSPGDNAADLPRIGQAPQFELIELSGRILSSSELEGLPWIANFVFTRCTGPCPLLSLHMQRIQKATVDIEGLRLVSFSVDPTTDTPEVLAKYAESFGADPERWLFLTGERKVVYELVRDGFKLAVVDERDEGHAMHNAKPEDVITHSTRFVLVDAEGVIRGYYDGSEPEVVERISSDARTLLGGQ